ncbi:MAG: PLP-dependent aminotransferase family protein [Chloroflexi bacterium]|nr:PLP-dependent aminotransferase family protein [Chloroflexota bacterium]
MLPSNPFEIRLDRNDPRPLYRQIKDALAAAIESGELPPSTRLPATRALAQKLGVDRVTVVTAYNELAAEGLIQSHVGRGSFVLDPASLTGRHETPPAPPSLRAPDEWTAHNFNREMMRLARRPDIITFGPGMPATDLLPADDYRFALNAVLRRDGPEVLQYGPIEGHPPLQAAIAEELAGFGVHIRPEQALITSGAEQALSLAMRTVLRTGDAVLVEQPTYLHVLDLLAGSGIEAHPAPCDEQGARADALPELIERHRPRLLYLTPTYQNPTGVCMPLARRREILQLAAAHHLLILEDDVYRHLWLDAPPPPPLRALDPADNVIYVNGYSKCLLPGARIGYLLAPQRLHAELEAAHQTLDLTATELSQRALALLFEQSRFRQHLERVRAAYRERRRAMLEALTDYMPPGASWTRPAGGLFLWLRLPPGGPSATTLYVHALDLGVAFAPGHLFYLPERVKADDAAHSLRLNFTLYPPPIIRDGIRRLARAWERAGGELPSS